jgi:hypothetical protein
MYRVWSAIDTAVQGALKVMRAVIEVQQALRGIAELWSPRTTLLI